SGLGGREMRKSWLAPQAGGRPGENDGAAPERGQPARRLAADEEAAKAADAPEILELSRRQLTEIDALIVARIEDHKAGRVTAVARRHGQIEQANDIILAGRVDRH